MMQEARVEQGKFNQWEQALIRVHEYKRPTEEPKDAARSMALRMMYFAEVISPKLKYDTRLPIIRKSIIRDGNFARGLLLAQEIYEEYKTRNNYQEEDLLLNYLIDLPKLLRSMPGIERLTWLKTMLRNAKSNPFPAEIPLFLAERRLMKRQAWEEQLGNIEAKLKDTTNMIPINKHIRILRDHDRLTQLVQFS